MLESFTVCARKVMALANCAAQNFNHPAINAEHILLGLLGEGDGIGPQALELFGLNLKSTAEEFTTTIQPGSTLPTPKALPQTLQAKKIIEYAINIARELGHNYIGTEHMLLALLRWESPAQKFLIELGLTEDMVKEKILAVIEAEENHETLEPTPLPERRTTAEFLHDCAKTIVKGQDSEETIIAMLASRTLPLTAINQPIISADPRITGQRLMLLCIKSYTPDIIQYLLSLDASLAVTEVDQAEKVMGPESIHTAALILELGMGSLDNSRRLLREAIASADNPGKAAAANRWVNFLRQRGKWRE